MTIRQFLFNWLSLVILDAHCGTKENNSQYIIYSSFIHQPGSNEPLLNLHRVSKKATTPYFFKK